MRTGWQWTEGKGKGISGEKGEGFAGIIIRTHGQLRGWDGNGREVGWGEKAENCTWTTIKINKYKKCS